MLVPLTIAGAGMLSQSNVSKITTNLQSAADSAVLSASRLNDDDSKRTEAALRIFNTLVPDNIRATLTSVAFTMDANANTITADISATIPSIMPQIATPNAQQIRVRSVSAVAKPDIKQLDVVMCIDATGSMQNTINAVKTNALNFESNLNSELSNRGITAFDVMRVRVVFFRDFGGTNRTGSSYLKAVWTGTKWDYVTVTSSDPDYWKGVGDTPPIKESSFFPLPANRVDFSDYVNPESASGGGDAPESGLECVNSAMSSAWARIGDRVPGTVKSLDAVYPLVIVWTDAAAHRPSYSVSLKNPLYPAADVMPRTYNDLAAKWASPAIIDQNRKMLVFFGNPDLNSNDVDGRADGWTKVKTWPGFILGGTLSEGNSKMVSKLADAISSRIRQPTLTQ